MGAFDEAFKSRIQLALHYKNLTSGQQRKIWRNFFTQLRQRDPDSIDFVEITDHIDELAKEDMDGQQIRMPLRRLDSWRKSRGRSSLATI